ncbi:MAG: carboxymuconolactone decarboxylase family protein, partial [Planctomycetota bacterium]
MLPKKMRQSMFETVSGVTMRKFFRPPTVVEARGLAARVLEQSREDFFINGTITSQAACPDLMAGMWCGGREASLVDHHLPASLKKAMGAALSQANQCPYCEDMLLSLTHGAKQDGMAKAIRDGKDGDIDDALSRRRVEWARSAVCADAPELRDPPFTAEELPEAIGTLLVFGYTNRITDVTMNGSPVPKTGRNIALKLFGKE